MSHRKNDDNDPDDRPSTLAGGKTVRKVVRERTRRRCENLLLE